MGVKDKKFYWLKLKTEFMNSETIDFLMSQKNGANYVVLYQMLALKAINTQGKLCSEVGDVLIPFNVEKIQRDCKWFDVDTIRVALELYSKLGLVYKNEEDIIQIANFDDLVGSETYWAKQKRLKEKESVGKSLENFQQPLISNISNSNIYNNIEEKQESKKQGIENLGVEFQELFNYWNSKSIIVHKELTDLISKAIQKALKVYKVEEIKTYIDRYATVIKDKNYYFDTKWTLAEFLTQKNAMADFTNEGSKWLNYQARTSAKVDISWGRTKVDYSGLFDNLEDLNFGKELCGKK